MEAIYSFAIQHHFFTCGSKQLFYSHTLWNLNYALGLDVHCFWVCVSYILYCMNPFLLASWEVISHSCNL